MTVGIAAIAQSTGDSRVVVSADRMVTVGESGGIEYEDTESKIEPLLEQEGICAVAVGAGSTTYIDEVFQTARSLLNDSEYDPSTMREALHFCNSAYQHTIRETVANQVLAPLGYNLEDLRDGEISVPSEIQKAVFKRAANIREKMAKNVQLLLAGVGEDGPGIYLMAGGDFNNYTDTGYWVIGSGADSAGLTLIRRDYDPRLSLREGVFTVLEAKDQAEERQGVGQRMDICIVSEGEIDVLDDERKRELRNLLSMAKKREQDARETVMKEWEEPR